MTSVELPEFFKHKQDDFLIRRIDGRVLSTDEHIFGKDWNKIEITPLYRIKCVYFLYDKNKNLVYIGQTKNLEQRLKQHKYDKDFKYYNFKEIPTRKEALRVESFYIDYYRPKYNRMIPNSGKGVIA